VLTDKPKGHTDEYKESAQRIFNTPDGRIVLRYLFARYVVGEKFHLDGCMNAKTTAERDLVLNLVEDIYEDTEKMLAYVERLQQTAFDSQHTN